MVNRYTQKDVKELANMMAANVNKAYEMMGAGTSPHTYISMIRSYGNRLPLVSINYFLNLDTHDLIYNKPFKDVPSFINVDSTKLVAEWRLRIGK